MKHPVIIRTAVIALVSTVPWSSALAAESAAGEPDQPVHVERNAAGQTVVAVNDATIKRLELKWETVKPASLRPEVRAFGRVLDPGPLLELLNRHRAAELAAATTSAEFERVKKLKSEDNASDRAVEQAGAAAGRDKLQAELSTQLLRLKWGDTISIDKLMKWTPELLNGNRRLVRLDLEAGVALSPAPTNARIQLPDRSAKSMDIELLGRLPSVSPELQGPSWLAVADGANTSLAPGLVVGAHLSSAGEAQPGVTVSRDAILRADGRTWVYRKEMDDSFIRCEVTLDRPLTDGWFVTQGLKAGDEVVTQGAATLLSTEVQFHTAGGGGEEE